MLRRAVCRGRKSACGCGQFLASAGQRCEPLSPWPLHPYTTESRMLPSLIWGLLCPSCTVGDATSSCWTHGNFYDAPGFSDLVVPRPGFWPSSIEVTPFLQPPLQWFSGMVLPEQLSAFIDGCVEGPVCLDSASSGHLGHVKSWQSVLKVFTRALEKSNR